ncbi:MAG: DUF262 domain-containing protein [Lachnospiraceae bacterium]|nr:DUF262 domain-containing protein [Lachnospiraceae bacterium]
MNRRPRRQTYPLETYLKKMLEGDIRSDQDVQRMAGQWTKNMKNELIFVVLTDDYIPPIILGEHIENSQLYIIEGLQRSSTLDEFRNGNYKISSDVKEFLVDYDRRVTDKNGKFVKDPQGEFVKETVQFDIRNKTYSDLPKELKKVFNEFQLECAIHEKCTTQRMCDLVERYNNNKPMNTAQAGFTYISRYARTIREITACDFFKDCGNYTENERIKGVYEKIVMESIMLINHFDKWTKQPKSIGKYLNTNSNDEEFASFMKLLQRLTPLLDEKEDIKSLFTSKNSFIWFALFDKFRKLNVADKKFEDFLHKFVSDLQLKEIDGISWAELEKERGTKDRGVITRKLNLLEQLLMDYLHVNKEEVLSETKENVSEDGTEIEKEVSIFDFVKENVKEDVTEEDIDDYYGMLDIYKVDKHSSLLEWKNEPSLIALIAYSFEKEIDLDNWIIDFFHRNNDYLEDQKENYIYMKKDLSEYLSKEREGMHLHH